MEYDVCNTLHYLVVAWWLWLPLRYSVAVNCAVFFLCFVFSCYTTVVHISGMLCGCCLLSSFFIHYRDPDRRFLSCPCPCSPPRPHSFCLRGAAVSNGNVRHDGVGAEANEKQRGLHRAQERFVKSLHLEVKQDRKALHMTGQIWQNQLPTEAELTTTRL